jgi:hypothetical protein
MIEHSELASNHKLKLKSKYVPRAAKQHHKEAAKNHRQIARALGRDMDHVDRKIEVLQDARSSGHDTHEGLGAHLAHNMLRTADRATKSASVSRKGMDKMTSDVPAWARGRKPAIAGHARPGQARAATRARHGPRLWLRYLKA